MASEDSSNTSQLVVGSMVSFQLKRCGEFFRGIVYFFNPEDGYFGMDNVSRGWDKRSYNFAEGNFQFLVKDIKNLRVLIPATTPTTTNTTKDDQKKSGPDDAIPSNAKDEEMGKPDEATSSKTEDEQKGSLGEASSSNTNVNAEAKNFKNLTIDE